MKSYIKHAVKELQASEKLKIEIELKKPKDFKKNFLRLAYNKTILTLQTRLVPCHFKNWLLRTTGMNIGHDACIPHYIYFDPYFPELIILEKGCIVGGGSKLFTHEIRENKLILGKTILKERTLLGGMSTLKPGSVISKHSILNSDSELDKKIPEGELWGGKPAKLWKKFSVEELEKYFKPSDGNYQAYYKDFRKKVNEFIKDQSQTYFKVHYNGKRLNAGDDWWRARNFFKIWYNGIIIETTRLLPHCWLKTLLLKMAGVKIGKNVKIGKRVVFDHIYCDMTTLEDQVVLEDDCYLDGHSYTISQTIFGRTLVKKGAHLKHHTFVATGSTIGENSITEPHSGVQKVIPPNELWGGSPAQFKSKLP